MTTQGNQKRYHVVLGPRDPAALPLLDVTLAADDPQAAVAAAQEHLPPEDARLVRYTLVEPA